MPYISGVSNLLLLNVQSITNKCSELIQIANLHKADIIEINETWLNSNYNINLFIYSNFQCFISNRENRRGGGVMLQFNSGFHIE